MELHHRISRLYLTMMLLNIRTYMIASLILGHVLHTCVLGRGFARCSILGCLNVSAAGGGCRHGCLKGVWRDLLAMSHRLLCYQHRLQISTSAVCCYGHSGIQYLVYSRRTPQPVIVTIRDNEDYIRLLVYSYYTTVTGWGS